MDFEKIKISITICTQSKYSFDLFPVALAFGKL